MSVQSEINRLTAARDALAAWLTEKGVTVPEDATLETLVVLAAQITNGVQTVNGVEPDENGNVEIDTSDLFVVTFTGNSAETEFTSDRTFAEISEAYEAGMRVVAVQGKLIIDLAQFVSGEFAAFDVWMMPFSSSETVMYRHYVVFADDTVQFQDNYLLGSNGTKTGMLKLTGTTLSIAQAGTDYVEPGDLESIDTGVLTVNGVAPDENGNVEIEAGGVQTVNGVEPDENGNVDVDVESDVFIATYGTTTSAEIEEAYQAGKVVLCKGSTTNVGILITRILETVHQFLFAGVGIVATCNNNEWSETAFTAAPATHASTHKTGGTDPITAAAIGAVPKSGGTMTGALTLSGDPTADLHAATKRYVDNATENAASTPIYRLITLSASAWDETTMQQIADVEGVNSDENTQLIQVMPATSNNNEYFEAGVLCTAQDADELYFTCGVVPTVDLQVYVTITEVSA